jgi:uncharacterized protein (DUF1330 family)
MAAYVIADVEVVDPEEYKEYSSQVPDSLRPYGGRFLVRGGATEVLEGSWDPQRVVIIEFPSVEKARDWYTSSQYRAILPIRTRHARSSLILVEGVEA